jgi:YVTN family beta-propeller protein
VVGIALTPDGGTLVAALMLAGEVVAIDLATGAERRVILDMDPLPYDVVISPDGATAFVSTWGGSAVVPIALATMTAGAPIPVGKNPEGLALSPDGTRLVAAGSDSDSLTVIDVATRAVIGSVWIAAETAPRGSSPVSVAFDSRGRLYAANAGDASVDVFAPDATTYTRIGRIPTTWYPTDVRVFSGDRVAVVTGKHDGKGPNTTPETLEIDDLGRGSLSIFEAAELTDVQLDTWSMEVIANNERGARLQEVVCPDGAPYDFPIPEPGGGPSTAIDHVVLVVRENKTYDSYYGGLESGRGDPSLTIVPAAEMEMVLPNTLALGRGFTVLDNYYSASDRSIQGHIWTVFGRTTDFVERTQGTTSGRGYWGVTPAGVTAPGVAEEGNAFDWMLRHGIEADNFGEIVAARSVSPSPRYPGLVYTMDISDVARADFLAREWAVRCRMKTFSYVLMPNDHTFGLDPGKPTPRAMMADNDAGLGRLVHAVSHSTYWPRTAIFVVEDDPQTGGDHIDNHRAPAIVISPWARRGHVDGVIANEASVYRTIQLILGIGEPLNAYWANAAPLYDAFTSTPDYTPYEMIPRRWPEETNPDDGSGAAALSATYDWSDPDEQPGLGRLVFRHLRPDRLPPR